MEYILACLILVAIVGVAAWKFFSTKKSIVVEPIAPYKVEKPVVAVVKPAKIRAKKQKAPAVVAEAVVEPVKAKRTKSKKV